MFVGAGVVYAVIIAMWAIVLVPMWLQRHDQTSEVRSEARFRGAMSSLSRTEVAEPAAYTPSVASPQVAAAARRRTVFLGLTLVVLLAVAGALFGVLPYWLPAAPMLLLFAFLAAAWQAVQRAPSAAVGRVVTKSDGQDLRHDSLPIAPAAPTAPVLRPGEWVATSTPLPTYVTAPPATRIPRLLDLRTPGQWTSAAMLDQVQAQRQARVQMRSFADLFVDDAPSVDVGDDTLEVVLDRRAANG